MDAPGWRPDTPLNRPVLAHDSAQVQRLVQQGTDLEHHGSALRASSVTGARRLIELLPAAGWDVNIEPSYGLSPVQIARLTSTVDLARFFTDIPDMPLPSGDEFDSAPRRATGRRRHLSSHGPSPHSMS